MRLALPLCLPLWSTLSALSGTWLLLLLCWLPVAAVMERVLPLLRREAVA